MAPMGWGWTQRKTEEARWPPVHGAARWQRHMHGGRGTVATVELLGDSGEGTVASSPWAGPRPK